MHAKGEIVKGGKVQQEEGQGLGAKESVRLYCGGRLLKENSHAVK